MKERGVEKFGKPLFGNFFFSVRLNLPCSGGSKYREADEESEELFPAVGGAAAACNFCRSWRMSWVSSMCLIVGQSFYHSTGVEILDQQLPARPLVSDIM